jgi:transcriptional regulator GlxA family with amidase domain
MKAINIILFNDFTTLDALGPAEVFSKINQVYTINYYSIDGGLISSSTHTKIETQRMEDILQNDIMLIPGGWGARQRVSDDVFIDHLRKIAEKSDYVLCVCTGSALLAKTGLLDNRKATSNKLSWEWVVAQNEKVNWIKKARWVVDGKYYTSSGITAGIDMSLGFISDHMGDEVARKVSHVLEYLWNENKEEDPFSANNIKK